MTDKERKHYNCTWCGTSLGYHAHEWDAIQGRNYCPRCQKPLWSSYENHIIPQVFAARPCVGQRVLA